MDRRSRAWAKSGAMSLTGRSGGPPLGAPGALVDLVEEAATVVRARSGGRVECDGMALLGERAAIGHLTRQGNVSCGGSTRLLRAADGWVAVSLARADDVAALPAWLQSALSGPDPWPELIDAVAHRRVSTLDARAALLGLPFAALGSVLPRADDEFGLPIGASRFSRGDHATRPIADAVVVDLSTLWAGPLCAQLLGEAGATVIKVESTARPDGARRGPAGFFDLLNGTKCSVALDLRTPAGVRHLHRLLAGADVVIESARPRALRQMGIEVNELLERARGPRVWASITSHGRQEDACARVGFGDVAAVAGGLIAGDDQGPCFVADAVMDPVTGLITAAAVLEALAGGGRWLLDAAMAPLAARLAGEPVAVGGLAAEEARARRPVCAAPALGSHTADVLADLA